MWHGNNGRRRQLPDAESYARSNAAAGSAADAQAYTDSYAAIDGITYETALASVDVFVAAVALLCEVDEAAVSVVISQARRRHLRRRLDDAGSVVVTYTVAVETEAAAASVSTLVEDSSTEDVSIAVKTAATKAGADEDFAKHSTSIGETLWAHNLARVCRSVTVM